MADEQTRKMGCFGGDVAEAYSENGDIGRRQRRLNRLQDGVVEKQDVGRQSTQEQVRNRVGRGMNAMLTAGKDIGFPMATTANSFEAGS